MKDPLSWPCPQLTPVSSLCLMGTLVGSGLLTLSRTLQALILHLQEHSSLAARAILYVRICLHLLPMSGHMVSMHRNLASIGILPVPVFALVERTAA